MSADETAVRAEAVAWAVRAHDESFEAWDELTEWLAADPRHAIHYDRATIAAEDGGALPLPAADVRAAQQERPVRKAVPGWISLAMAASVIAAVGGGVALHNGSRVDPVQFATRAGEMRELRLDGGVRIMLNGATSLTLDRHDPRSARLDQGEALFVVNHDAAHPFRLDTGDAIVTDIGTTFDVERGNGPTTIGVAEGKVNVAVPGNAIDAGAGQVVSIDRARSELIRRSQDSALIGSWHDGRIDFDDLPLATLAVRLQRATGMSMTIAAALRIRRASGSIIVSRDPEAVRRQLAQMLDIVIERKGTTWLWRERDGAGTS